MARGPRTLLTGLLAGLAVTGSAAALAGGSPDEARPARVFVDGSLRLANSKEGSAILDAAGLKPGGSTTGTVGISNAGERPGEFVLSESGLADAGGPNGGLLSRRLDLLVEDLTEGDVVYSGKLDSMGPRALGAFAAGESRTYRFSVSLPDAGIPPTAVTGDNAYQGSSASVQFDWMATDAADTPANARAEPRGARIRLAGRAHQVLGSRGLVMRARCWSPCTLRAWGALQGERAKATRTRPTGGTTRADWTLLRFRFPGRALRTIEERLARTMWVRMKVTAEAVGPQGETVSISRTIRVRRAISSSSPPR
jgi:hypothetical protein